MSSAIITYGSLSFYVRIPGHKSRHFGSVAVIHKS
ncbi:hypothetical protein CGRA01v4_07958 [Colletotrichum graminicola]|nr:hypothetical protein CGRA01v4_07958 [Colletotrichum graminicola]